MRWCAEDRGLALRWHAGLVEYCVAFQPQLPVGGKPADAELRSEGSRSGLLIR